MAELQQPLINEAPPIGLDEYVDWANDRICKRQAGPYQCRAIWLLSSVWIITTMNTYAYNFVTLEPDVGAQSGRVLDLGGREECNAKERHLYGESCPELDHQTCGPQGTKNKELHRDKWTYRDPGNSAIAEFDLSACANGNRGLVVTFVGSLFWAGFGLGVVTGGFISDAIGRCSTWFLYLTIMLISSVLFSSAPNYQLWALSRFLGAVGGGGFGITAYVWASESVGVESQHSLAVISSFYFVVGGCAVAPLALWVQAWRPYAGIVGALLLPCYIPPLFVYESPKWLAAKGRRDEVYKVMCGIAAANSQVEPPPPVGASPGSKDASRLKGVRSGNLAEAADTEGWKAFFHPRVKSRLIATSLLWMVTSYAYYGLSLFAPPNVFANPTISWCFGFIVEMPAYLVAGYMINSRTFGRRLTTSGGVILCGLTLGLVALSGLFAFGGALQLDALYYPARMFIAAAFTVLYPWSSETFPSSIRNSAMGINSLMARVGGILAPWVGLVNPFSVRMLLFASPTLLAGAGAFLLLPETRGKPLPGSVADLDK